MSEELIALIKDYSEKFRAWQDLLSQERIVRADIISDADDKGEEPDNLRDLLEETVENSGLREQQVATLTALKEAERKLFAFNFEHCEDPILLGELEHLAQDYAARITWLQQFLEVYDKISGEENSENSLQQEVTQESSPEEEASLEEHVVEQTEIQPAEEAKSTSKVKAQTTAKSPAKSASKTTAKSNAKASSKSTDKSEAKSTSKTKSKTTAKSSTKSASKAPAKKSAAKSSSKSKTDEAKGASTQD
ncbi:MAG: hypothetical protein Q4D97_02540 [Eubacteriales bacterium]|nr:hypothetical protein [Eubacteriales bacterium]